MKILSPREAAGLVKRAFEGWKEDGATSMGAALAFYTLFSLAPLLLVALAVAGIFFDRAQAQDLLIGQLSQLVGERPAQGIQALLQAASDESAAKKSAVLGFFTLLLGATTVFAELRTDLNRIWHCKAEKVNGVWDFVRTRLLSFGLVVSIGFLLLVSLVVSAVLSAVGDMFLPGSALMARIAEFAASLVVLTALFAMIYKFLPSRRVEWRDVWVGAAVTSLLFWVGKFAIGLYIAHSAVASSFGAAGTVVVIIAWVYYSSLIFFLGAEFTREYALHLGSAALPESKVSAANDEHHLLERAREIVKGKDPILTRRETPST
ncbi:MAG TPA: YihY/virulence factor BrkB family protein [Usitatibacter sp.]|nr:YihY/virulence factor BrkB family protein [Usitatibacter sp.]